MKASVIVNPRASSGRAARVARSLSRALEAAGLDHEVLETERPDHAGQLAVSARNGGADVLVVVGGDGTLNEVAQAYVDESGSPRPGPALALMPAGTGGDFARALGFDRDVASATRRIAQGRERSVDLGVLALRDSSGQPVRRAFVNVASLGISGAVDQHVERGSKWLGGKAAFLLGTVRATLAYRNVAIEIAVDGETWHRGRVVVAALGNAPYFGGGMKVAPDARWDDGLLDVVCVGDLTRGQLVAALPQIYSGKHLSHPSVRATRGRRVSIRPLRDEPPLLVDADGQTPGFAPLTAEIHPGALRLLT